MQNAKKCKSGSLPLLLPTLLLLNPLLLLLLLLLTSQMATLGLTPAMSTSPSLWGPWGPLGPMGPWAPWAPAAGLLSAAVYIG